METFDEASPVPLYHQIFESLRYRIAIGDLRPGAQLPSLREAAEEWKVNLHTVRRAYQRLAQQELVAVKRGSGVHVLPGAAPGSSRAADRFVETAIRTAQDRYAMNPQVLARRILAIASAPTAMQPVAMVECSMGQAADYASQIQSRWEIDVQLFSLENVRDPPVGTIISTYFHYNEIRRRWPRRASDMRFLAVRPDPRLAEELGTRRGRRRIIVAETDHARGASIRADVESLFARERFDVHLRIGRAVQDIAARAGRAPVVVAPRLWFALSDDVRASGAIRQLRYLLDREDVDRLARHFAWTRTAVAA